MTNDLELSDGEELFLEIFLPEEGKKKNVCQTNVEKRNGGRDQEDESEKELMARGVDEFPNPQSRMLGPRVQPQAWMHYNSRIGGCWEVTTIATAAFADVGGYSLSLIHI